MDALTYRGARDVRVEPHPDPVLEAPDDIVLRVTATAICGSDLHIYRGKIPHVEHGDVLGHEFMGVVESAGPDVTGLHVGDRVVVPFVIACGSCFFCARQLYAACETTNVQRSASEGRGAILNKKSLRSGAALFGYSHPSYIASGALEPERIISHRLPLAEAAEGYRLFDEKRDGCTKVVLWVG